MFCFFTRPIKILSSFVFELLVSSVHAGFFPKLGKKKNFETRISELNVSKNSSVVIRKLSFYFQVGFTVDFK
jgi:hypothetical protein